MPLVLHLQRARQVERVGAVARADPQPTGLGHYPRGYGFAQRALRNGREFSPIQARASGEVPVLEPANLYLAPTNHGDLARAVAAHVAAHECHDVLLWNRRLVDARDQERYRWEQRAQLGVERA